MDKIASLLFSNLKGYSRKDYGGEGCLFKQGRYNVEMFVFLIRSGWGMPGRFLLFAVFSFLGFTLHAQSGEQGLAGTWVSKGKYETRTLVLDDNGKGQFLSKHQQGSCGATLQAVIDGQFAMASGVAQNCQQVNNAVAFEFYCQQTDTDRIRCKIRSSHEKSGSSKEGIEDFERL